MLKYILALFLCLPIFADTISGKVIYIVDGDTLDILLEDKSKERIRLAGIDSPERGQEFGTKATRYLASLVKRKYVTVEFNKRDRNGRIVGKIIYNDEDINLKMVKVGYGWWYEKYKREQSQDDQISYRVAWRNAQKFNLGLFQSTSAIPPWDWRKDKKNLRKLKPKNQLKEKTVLTKTEGLIKVWVNLNSGRKYHCPETRYYQNTKKGQLMLQSEALERGFSGAHGRSCY